MTIRASAGSSDRASRIESAADEGATVTRSARPLERDRPAPARQRLRPVRPRLRLRRPRRGDSHGAEVGHGGRPHTRRDAALGERRQGTERDAEAGHGLHGVHARRSPPATQAAPTATPSSASGRSGTSRTSSSSSSRSSTPAAGRWRRGTTRRLYAAGYAGIKAGNPRSLVAMGETSARGTDNPKGVRPVHSPGRFVEELARANPRLRFDAWSHHPYPFTPNLKPSQ